MANNKQKKMVPELRFKGFHDDWVQHKLGDLGKVAMNRRIFKDQTVPSGGVPFFKIGTFGEKPDAFISRKLFDEYKAKYPYPKVGDLLISASGSIGRIVEYVGRDEYFQDSNIVWLEHDERLTNSFLKQFYGVVRWQGLEGSTIKRLYNKNILQTRINLPSVQEQNMIGDFLGNLDCAITLQQEKLNLLKQLKRGYLQKLFPVGSAKQPELRFAGFDGDWKQCKLGKLFKKANEKNVSLKYNASDVLSAASMTNTDRDINSDDDYMRTYNVIHRGDILYEGHTSKNYAFGRFILNDYRDGIVSHIFDVYRPRVLFDSSFLKEYIHTESVIRPVLVRSTSSARMLNALDKVEFANQKILLPSLTEQKSIGSLLAHLNSVISFQQLKLEALTRLKQAYLQKLFV